MGGEGGNRLKFCIAFLAAAWPVGFSGSTPGGKRLWGSWGEARQASWPPPPRSIRPWSLQIQWFPLPGVLPLSSQMTSSSHLWNLCKVLSAEEIPRNVAMWDVGGNQRRAVMLITSEKARLPPWGSLCEFSRLPGPLPAAHCHGRRYGALARLCYLIIPWAWGSQLPQAIVCHTGPPSSP